MNKLKISNIGDNQNLFIKRLQKLKPLFIQTIIEDFKAGDLYEMFYIILSNLKFLNDNKVFDYSKKELKEILLKLPKKNTVLFNNLITTLSNNLNIIVKQQIIENKIVQQQLGDDNYVEVSEIENDTKIKLSNDEKETIIETVGLQSSNYSIVNADTLTGIVTDSIFEVTGNNVIDISTNDYTDIYMECEDLYLTEMNVQESYVEDYMY